MKNLKVRSTLIALAVTVLVAIPIGAQVKDHRDIKYPKLPDRQVPRPEVHTLANGLQIFLMEDHELPLISVTGRIRTGSNYESADKSGLAGFVGQVMREGGTKSMDGDSIDDYLESRAAFVETGMGGDFGSASMNCLKEDFDDVLAVFADVLRNPAFSEDKLELAKQQTKTNIARRNDDIGGIAGREFSRLIYGADSPLTQLVEYATVASITRDDLVSWHNRYYHPNNVMLGVVGDFDSSSIKRKIEAAFADWPKGPAAELPEIAVNEPEPGVHFVEKSDVTQAYVRIGHRGIRRDNPDYYAVQVMNEIFGGGFSARLFSNVRSEKGLAYNVRGTIGSGYVRKGIFSVALSTKSETMAASIDALRVEIDSILASPPTDNEMARSKESILNSFVFNSTSKRQILGQQLTYAYFGYPADFLERYRSGIEKVTKDDVARVAKKYIHPDKLVTLVVGKSEDFDRPVSDFGTVNVVDITIPAPKSTGPKMARNAETVAAGKELLARSAQHINGANSPATSVDGDYTIALTMGGQTMSLGRRVSIQLPDKMRQTFTTPMGEQTLLINGNRGLVIAGGQKQPFPEDQVGTQLEDLNRELLFLVGHADDAEAVAGGTSEMNGTPCNVVSVSFSGIESVLCVDDAGKIISQTYQGEHPMQRTPGEIIVVYSDYRDVSGYNLPHKRLMRFDGQEIATVATNTIAVNPDFDATTFEISE